MPSMSLSQLAGQTLVVGFPGGGPPREVRALAEGGALGGYILFKRNLGAPQEVAALIAEITRQTPADHPLLISVDQEGGRVERLKHPVLELPAMQRLAATQNVDLIRRSARVLGRQLRALGFTLDFAPVLDVNTNPENPVIGDRSFGEHARAVIDTAFAFAEGLSDANVLSCGKHFPGHGDTFLDSHLALPTLTHERQRLEHVELPPFASAKGRLPSIMTAHVVFEAFERDVPATFSKRVMTDLLRGELGYDGAVFSDDLEMKAVADHWPIEESAVRAVTAGCDLLLVCSNTEWTMRAHAALVQEAEKSPAFRARLEEAAKRSLAMRAKVPAPCPITDAGALARALEVGGERDRLRDELAALR